MTVTVTAQPPGGGVAVADRVGPGVIVRVRLGGSDVSHVRPIPINIAEKDCTVTTGEL